MPGIDKLVLPLRRVAAPLFARVMRTAFAQRFLAPYYNTVQLRLYRLTRGRLQISALLVPSLILYTTGAKTGRRRETPLMCWPEPDGSFLVAGSNWGQPHHPAWTANLCANPDAEIVYRRRTIPVRAHLFDDHEREAVWPRLERQFPGYRQYEAVAGRPVRVFRLIPTATARPARG